MAYLKFGMENPEYYEIMFSRNTPKYIDYQGTAIEPTAFYESRRLSCRLILLSG